MTVILVIKVMGDWGNMDFSIWGKIVVWERGLLTVIYGIGVMGCDWGNMDFSIWGRIVVWERGLLTVIYGIGVMGCDWGNMDFSI